MGFLGRLFGGTEHREEADSVWLTTAAKLAGMGDRVVRHAETRQVLLLAHFPRTLDAVGGALLGRVRTERARSESDVASCLAAPRAGATCLALISQLPARAPQVFGDLGTEVSLLVAERHPLREQDDLVESLAGSLPYPSSVRFHLSLEDPLLEQFAGDRLTSLMAQLGVDEDEELSHPMISKAVERTQAKLAARQHPETEAESVEDWLRSVGPE